MADGEIGLESDTGKFKFGNGTQAWTSLAYFSPPADISAAWPIGSIFMSAVATNPNTLLGFGTWAAFGTGRIPVGFDSGQTEFDVMGETGGSKTATPTGSVAAPVFTGTSSQATSAVSAGTPAGSNSAPTFTGDAVASTAVSAGTPAGTVAAPTFTGTSNINTSLVSAGTPAGTINNHTTAADSNTTGGTAKVTGPTTHSFTGSALGTHQHTLTPTGTNSAPAFTGSALGTHSHNTTATGTNSAPTFTGSALGTHSHTITPSGTNSAPAFTGNSMSILPPYIVLRMWQRTA